MNLPLVPGGSYADWDTIRSIGDRKGRERFLPAVEGAGMVLLGGAGGRYILCECLCVWLRFRLSRCEVSKGWARSRLQDEAEVYENEGEGGF